MSLDAKKSMTWEKLGMDDNEHKNSLMRVIKLEPKRVMSHFWDMIVVQNQMQVLTFCAIAKKFMSIKMKKNSKDVRKVSLKIEGSKNS